jgi:CheY-like chemotaxis protein
MSETPARILVVDDEPSITEFVSYNLKKEGYEVAVAEDGDEALELAAAASFDLVVLDVMLPGMDGYEVCRRLRATSSVPVLFLSARDTELDKVVGLEIGGDDYLAKPFGVRELTARVKALLRRVQTGSREAAVSPEKVVVSGVTLDEAAHEATADGSPEWARVPGASPIPAPRPRSSTGSRRFCRRSGGPPDVPPLRRPSSRALRRHRRRRHERHRRGPPAVRGHGLGLRSEPE